MRLTGRRIRQLYIWHKWAGLLTGLFVGVLSASGAVAVFKPEIDRLVTPALRVRPGAQKVALDEALAAVKRAYPGAEVGGAQFPARPDTAYTILAQQGGASREIFVDPYTGQVTGARSGETVANVIRQLHVRFYFFGWQGRVAVGLFGLMLLFSSLTGLVIYARFMRGVFAQRLRFWQIRRGQGPKLATSDWHKLVGLLALAFNLVIGLTGAVLGLENLTRYAPGIDRAIHPRPQPGARRDGPADPAARLTAEEALKTARAALPGLEPTGLLLPPARADYFTVYGNLAGRLERESASFVLVGAERGEVRDRYSAAGGGAAVRAYDLSEPLHFGNFGGPGLKVAYALLGMTSGFLSVTGFMLWAFKRRRRVRSGPEATGGHGRPSGERRPVAALERTKS